MSIEFFCRKDSEAIIDSLGLEEMIVVPDDTTHPYGLFIIIRREDLNGQKFFTCIETDCRWISRKDGAPWVEHEGSKTVVATLAYMAGLLSHKIKHLSSVRIYKPSGLGDLP